MTTWDPSHHSLIQDSGVYLDNTQEDDEELIFSWTKLKAFEKIIFFL